MNEEDERKWKSQVASKNCYHGCGRKADKISSGSPECWPCWNRRKLDLPAAEHWARVGEEFLSNVDMYDLTQYFAKCGLSNEEAETMIRSAQKVRDYSKALVKAGYGEIAENTQS